MSSIPSYDSLREHRIPLPSSIQLCYLHDGMDMDTLLKVESQESLENNLAV